LDKFIKDAKKNLPKTITTFKYLPKALIFIGHNPFVFVYILLSSLLILCFIIFAFLIIIKFLPPRLESINALIDSSYEVAQVVKFISLIVSTVLALGFVVASINLVSVSVTSAIYSALVSKLYLRIYKENMPEEGFGKAIKLSIAFTFKQFLISVSIFLLTGLLNLIPFVGSYLYIAINLFQIILFTGINLFEPSLIKYQIPFRRKIKFILKSFYLWPYLLVCGFLSSIPIVNIFSIPICIISSSLIAKEQFVVLDKRVKPIDE